MRRLTCLANQEALFVVISPAQRVSADHPLRPVKRRCDDLLAQMNCPFSCDRFAEHGLVQAFFDALVRQAVLEGSVSDEHFRVDGTLIRLWDSLKILQPQDSSPTVEPPDDPGYPTVNFHGQRRTNAMHVSRTDPEARLARTRLVGRWKIAQEVLLTLSAYNWVR